MPVPRIAEWVSRLLMIRLLPLFARTDSKYSIKVQRHASTWRMGLDDMRTEPVQPCKFDVTDYGTPHFVVVSDRMEDTGNHQLTPVAPHTSSIPVTIVAC